MSRTRNITLAEELFNAVRDVPDTNGYQLAALLDREYTSVVGSLADMANAGLLIRERRHIEGHVQPVYHYITKVASYRWGVPERDALRITRAAVKAANVTRTTHIASQTRAAPPAANAVYGTVSITDTLKAQVQAAKPKPVPVVPADPLEVFKGWELAKVKEVYVRLKEVFA